MSEVMSAKEARWITILDRSESESGRPDETRQ